MATNIKLLKSEYQYCIFNTENFHLFDINEFSYNVISHFLKNKDITKTAKHYKLEECEITSLLNKIGYKLYNIHQNNDTIIPRNRVIDRITIHVSNDCNLRCKYCYASGGSYGKARSIMSTETAKKIVDYCCDNFKEIRNIVFFGGEPFLNYPIIEFICNNFQEKFNNGEIQTIPRFGAITNGTIQSAKVISIIKDFFSFITVSIDGPKEINDINRVTAFGHGSFDRIYNFLKQISSFSTLKISIEATYTKQHIERGYTREMIRDYFLNEFNLNADIVDEMSLDDSNMVISELEKPFESPWFDSILKTLVNKKTETKCQILRSTFAISSDGGIFPCHMNIGDGMDPILSIWDSEKKINDIIQYDKSYSLKDNDVCRNCWANNICGGCARLSFFDSLKKTYSHTPIVSKCDEFKHILEKTLLKICEVRRNTELWETLLSRINISHN